MYEGTGPPPSAACITVIRVYRVATPHMRAAGSRAEDSGNLRTRKTRGSAVLRQPPRRAYRRILQCLAG